MFIFNLTDRIEIFGIIYALILIAGFYQIGSLIFKIKPVNKIFSQISNVKYQKTFIAINLVLLIFYPLILYSDEINFIPILSISLFFLGLFKIFNKFKKKNNFNKIKTKLIKIKFDKQQIDKYLVLFTLSALFVLSLTPNTHGDSLGYHFVVAQKLLLTGNYTADITHFHSLLAGSGEIIIAIGLYFGSEQFGTLIQFSGLISIFGILKNIRKNDKYFYLLLILTSPVILFLSSTVKPQLFHICSTSVIFCLYFFDNKKNSNLNQKNWKIIISIFVLVVSVSAKFNFLISSFLLGLIILYNSIKDKNFLYFISIFVFIFFIFYFPIINWKVSNFGGYFYQYIYSPLPINIIGLDEFKNYLSGYGRQHDFITIFFTNKIGLFTNTVGIALLYLFIVNFRKTNALLTVMISLTYIIIQYYFGQFIGRSFLEPLFWILLICAKYSVSYKLKIFEFLCRLQSLVVIIGIVVGIYYLFPGSLTSNLKDKVLSQNANGYSLFKWANTKLEPDDVVFSIQRSISLGKSEYISTDFFPYVDFTSDRSEIFINSIKKKDPNFLLTWSSTNNPPMLYELKNCVGKLLHYKQNVGLFEARNPFNRGGSYDGFIFEFKKEKLPECIKK